MSKYITFGMEITAIGGGRAGTKVFYNFISIRLPTSEDTNGCWRWATEKPEMHDYVAAIFVRREDG